MHALGSGLIGCRAERQRPAKYRQRRRNARRHGGCRASAGAVAPLEPPILRSNRTPPPPSTSKWPCRSIISSTRPKTTTKNFLQPHTRSHARTHAQTPARTHARQHARQHASTRARAANKRHNYIIKMCDVKHSAHHTASTRAEPSRANEKL